MKVPEKYYDELFDFEGQWGVASTCGLKIRKCGEKTCLLLTELYQDNPGTSVTYAGYSLFRQICERKGLSEKETICIECNPDTNSKLSFYDEEFFEVSFPEVSGGSGRPAYKPLSAEDVKRIFT